jgi:recombination protein RecT
MATTNGIVKDLSTKLVTPGTQLTKNEFKSVIKSFESEIAEALPLHLKKNAEKYARQALSLFSQNPKLQQCAPVTVLSALMTASALGLDLTPQLGQCYIIPYDNRKYVDGRWVTTTEAQFQLGYRGAIALAQRSGEVIRIQADAVREKDHFKYSKGLYPVLEHEESLDEDRGEITHVYALANFKNGGYSFEVWPVAKVIANAKKFSKSYYKDEYDKNKRKTGNKIVNEKSPWYTDFESMAKKTLIMAIWKYLPVSTEVMLAATTDETIKSDLGDVRDERDIITIPSKSVDDGDIEFEESVPPKEIEAPKTPAPAQKQQQPGPDDFPFDDGPALPELSKAEKEAVSNALSSEEKLREKANEMLLVHLGLTENEADEWCLKNFGRKCSELSKKELETTITKGNAELDARQK